MARSVAAIDWEVFCDCSCEPRCQGRQKRAELTIAMNPEACSRRFRRLTNQVSQQRVTVQSFLTIWCGRLSGPLLHFRFVSIDCLLFDGPADFVADGFCRD